MPNQEIFYARCVCKLRYYSDVIHSFDWKSVIQHMVVFKMRDSVPSASYSSVCNVLRQWSISLIPTELIESTDSMIHKAGVAWEIG